MNDTPTEPSAIPPRMALLELSAEIMDHLMTYWKLKDHGEIFAWSARLLHDLSKLDEAGWRLTLTKCEIDETTRKVTYNPEYIQVYFLMKWLTTSKEGHSRLPTPEVLDLVTKVKK